MWQSLSFGPNYKAAYCLAVCPAWRGRDWALSHDKATYLKDTVRPLTEKEETLYVIAGSDAEEYAPRRFPKKKIKRVSSGIRSTSIDGFLFGLKLTFQPGKAANLNAVYHFTFTGKEEKQATVTIRDGTVEGRRRSSGQSRPACDRRQRRRGWVSWQKSRACWWALLRRRNPHQGIAEVARLPLASAFRRKIQWPDLKAPPHRIFDREKNHGPT